MTTYLLSPAGGNLSEVEAFFEAHVRGYDF